MTDIYLRLFVVDVVDNICNLFYVFVMFHSSFKFFIIIHLSFGLQ